MIEQQVPTLRERQKQIELDALQIRSKQKPRSKDLDHDQLKEIVATLEHKFDGYEGCKVTPAPDGSWREKALIQTIREVPMLSKTGFEIGPEPTLFGSAVQWNDATDALKRLKNETTGDWLGSLEVRDRIERENPSLRRTGHLTNASGRYSQDLVVSAGDTKLQGVRLPIVRGKQLQSLVKENTKEDTLVVIACLRSDDPQSRTAEAVLEQVQARLMQDPTTSKSASAQPRYDRCAYWINNIAIQKYSLAVICLNANSSLCKVFKCDLAESPTVVEQFRILAVPTFLMFVLARAESMHKVIYFDW